jgi:sugar O-acyltransferase (sialic acid O-acetyltransferase NeuD family)
MRVLIIGAGGHGKVVLDILRAQAVYQPVGFIDADPALTGRTVAGLPVLGQPNSLAKVAREHGAPAAIVAIGDNRVRHSYATLALESGLQLISAVHPSATVSLTATVGHNTVIAAGAVVCVEAEIGDSAIINTSAVVDHECRVGASAHIGPGALLAGRARVGVGAFVGMGARILPCIAIGDNAVVGAGAVVIADVPPGETVAGVPARVLHRSFPQQRPAGRIAVLRSGE